jgi:hypothetical protein
MNEIANALDTKVSAPALSPMSLIESKTLAAAFYESGIFKEIKNEASALVKIIAGREQGLTPIESMSSVYIFRDNILYATKVFLSKIKKSAKYKYICKQSTPDLCEIDFYENGELIGTSCFTKQDAITAGLINKDVYKNYRALMLFYRSASNGIKMFCPDILNGALLYEDYTEMNNDKENKPMTVNMETGEIVEQKTNDKDNEAEQALDDFFA